MEKVFSIQYEAKGEKEFLLPFSINKEENVVVWVNNNVLSASNYFIKFPDNEFNYFSSKLHGSDSCGKIVFYSEIGSVKVPKVVTIEKSIPIERKTDFKNFTNFHADSLNLELNNFIYILKSLQHTISNSVQKSKLEDNNIVVTIPKCIEGKGLYWGSNGEILNTDQNINDLLNELAHSKQPYVNSAKVLASKVIVDIKDTVIKNNNVQDFLQLVDLYISQLKDKQAKLIKSVQINSDDLTTVHNKVQSIITPSLSQTQSTITNLQKDITDLKQTLTQVCTNDTNIYAVLSAPKDKNNKTHYLTIEKNDNCMFKIVNISPSSPLILNFAYNGSSIKFIADDISKFVNPHCLMARRGKGRYYVTAELKEENKIYLMGHNVRPYFSYLSPTKEEIMLHGCDPKEYHYFVIKDKSFYRSKGRFKDKPWPVMYLGYYEVNENNEIISDVTYYTNGKTFDYYLDVTANSSYVVPNYLGCNTITVEIYAVYENNMLIPVCNQAKLNKDFPDILEMGTNFSFNVDQINIDTAANGVYGYYKGNKLIYAKSAKLKVTVTRKF